MSHKNTLTKGKVAFLDYYSHLLPHFPIPELTLYLTSKNTPVLLISKVFEKDLSDLWRKARLTWAPLPWFPSALEWPPEIIVGSSLPGFAEGWLYSLNRASLLSVLAINPQPGEAILDACAAPGGKTLAMANLTIGHKTLLIANDASFSRFKRLRTTLKHFGLPDIPTWRYPVQALIHRTQLTFDKILLDAPCSSEKHVYNSKKYLKIWSQNRIKTLSHLQHLLINSLVPLLNPHGVLVYSTCALTPEENEAVISKIVNQSHAPLSLQPFSAQIPIHGHGLTGYGLSIQQCAQVVRVNAPDSFFDPMFVAILKKN